MLGYIYVIHDRENGGNKTGKDVVIRGRTAQNRWINDQVNFAKKISQYRFLVMSFHQTGVLDFRTNDIFMDRTFDLFGIPNIMTRFAKKKKYVSV